MYMPCVGQTFERAVSQTECLAGIFGPILPAIVARLTSVIYLNFYSYVYVSIYVCLCVCVDGK